MKVGTFLEGWIQREHRSEALVQVVGLDPLNWQLADFSVSYDLPQSLDFGHIYSLVHVSLPAENKPKNENERYGPLNLHRSQFSQDLSGMQATGVR